MDEVFRVLLKEARRKAILKAKGPAKIPAVPTAWKYPTLLERKYANYLVRLISRMTKVGVEWVKTEYPAALEAYRQPTAWSWTPRPTNSPTACPAPWMPSSTPWD